MVPEAEFRRLVLEAAVADADGRKRLECAQAFALQARHGTPLARIGAICDEEGIRIVGCQLGCFK